MGGVQLPADAALVDKHNWRPCQSRMVESLHARTVCGSWATARRTAGSLVPTPKRRSVLSHPMLQSASAGPEAQSFGTAMDWLQVNARAAFLVPCRLWVSVFDALGMLSSTCLHPCNVLHKQGGLVCAPCSLQPAVSIYTSSIVLLMWCAQEGPAAPSQGAVEAEAAASEMALDLEPARQARGSLLPE